MWLNTRDFSRQVLSVLHDQTKCGQFCDVEVVVEDEHFFAHKAILAACSSYFRTMFLSGLQENTKRQIELREIDPGIFKILLYYMYTGALEIEHDLVEALLTTASMLQIHGVLNICSDFLVKELHPSNCLGIYQIAMILGCNDLGTKAWNFTEKNFEDVSEEEEFLSISEDILKNLLNNDALHVGREFEVLQAVIKWIEYDLESRLPYTSDLFNLIHTSSLNREQLNLICNECSGLLQEAMKMHFGEQLDPKQLTMRSCSKDSLGTKFSVFVIGGQAWRQRGELKSFEVFDSGSQQWKSNTFKYSRSRHSAVALGGLIYILGGEDHWGVTSSCQVYNPRTNQISLIADMRQVRVCFGACVARGYIYVMGGIQGRQILNSIERYDPDADQWTDVGTMRVPRANMGVIAHEGKIYVIGGCDSTWEPVNTLEVFNVRTRQWSDVPPMSSPRAKPGVALLGSNIYVAGGWNINGVSLQSVEKFSLEDKQWSDFTPLHTARHSPLAVNVNGQLMVMGGERSNREVLDSVEIYNSSTGQWEYGPPMLVPKRDAAVAVT